MLPVRDLEEKLALIRNGDGQAREDIIDAHRSFVTRVALKVCGRSLEWDRDDELIIGMTAFNEAIDRFDENRGVPFQAFARLIIKSRITDFLRRQQRHHTRSVGSLDDSSTQRITAFEVSQAWDRHLEQEAAREREEEIAEYQKVINELGIS
ncbi:MAG: sigma-70 family RNA polymerase sigma factor, partial [Desulfocucumaceae bacterium]